MYVVVILLFRLPFLLHLQVFRSLPALPPLQPASRRQGFSPIPILKRTVVHYFLIYHNNTDISLFFNVLTVRIIWNYFFLILQIVYEALIRSFLLAIQRKLEKAPSYWNKLLLNMISLSSLFFFKHALSFCFLYFLFINSFNRFVKFIAMSKADFFPFILFWDVLHCSLKNDDMLKEVYPEIYSSVQNPWANLHFFIFCF